MLGAKETENSIVMRHMYSTGQGEGRAGGGRRARRWGETNPMRAERAARRATPAGETAVHTAAPGTAVGAAAAAGQPHFPHQSKGIKPHGGRAWRRCPQQHAGTAGGGGGGKPQPSRPPPGGLGVKERSE